MNVKINDHQLELAVGDITEQTVDAIVNAANSRLAGGSGVDGAIHQRGGPAIMADTNERYPDGCPTGSAVISTAGNLPAKFVIHAVGPVWHGGGSGEADLLSGAYRRCLELAAENDCDSIAFPAISTGVYGYPIDKAAKVSLQTAIEFLKSHDRPNVVRFVLFSESAHDAFEAVLKKLVS